jgi:flagellar protein FlbD
VLLKASFMIQLTRLNRIPMVLNSDLIEHIEITPDTVITLTTGQKIVVLEPAQEVVERVVAFRRSVYQGLLNCPLVVHRERDPSAASEPV